MLNKRPSQVNRMRGAHPRESICSPLLRFDSLTLSGTAADAIRPIDYVSLIFSNLDYLDVFRYFKGKKQYLYMQ
ncbi:hypothetical protein [Sphingobacterium deserti]|uniref:hypothetical protein n=1 Tax=Sphingobacterium deserti TaxID=1229276 RepID=UPI00146FE393|nr:hypothetical protein [Sphingobacterium deserti]